MRLTKYIAGIMIVLSLLINGCSCSCGGCEEAIDSQGNQPTPPPMNNVDSCYQGQTIECAHGQAVSRCDCSQGYCRFGPCET